MVLSSYRRFSFLLKRVTSVGISWNSSFRHEPSDGNPLRKSKLARKQLSRLFLLRNRNTDDVGRILDAEKQISDKVAGESHCLSPLSLLLFLRLELLQGVRLASGYKLHSCRRISHPSLLPQVSREDGPPFLAGETSWHLVQLLHARWVAAAGSDLPAPPPSPPHSPSLFTLSPVIPSSTLIASCRTQNWFFSTRK